MAKTFIKYGGLLMSAALTIALFIDLFGKYGQFYSWVMALSALALFEGGTILWGRMIDTARGNQRGVAKLCMWLCVLASIVSSCVQIVMSTNLWKPDFDIGLFALFTIAGALAVNVVGVILFEFLDPDRAEKNRDFDRQARAQNEMYKLSDKVTEKALLKAGGMVEEISGDVSHQMAAEIQQDVMIYLLSQTRNGQNLMINQPAAVTHAKDAPPKKAEPTPIEKFKAAFGKQDAPLATLASDGAPGAGWSIPKHSESADEKFARISREIEVERNTPTGHVIPEPEDAIRMAAIDQERRRKDSNAPSIMHEKGYTMYDLDRMLEKMTPAQKMEFYNPGMAALQREIDMDLDRRGLTEISHEEGVAQYKAAQQKPAKKGRPKKS